MSDNNFDLFNDYPEDVQNELIFDFLTQRTNYLKDYALIHSQTKIYKPYYISPKHHRDCSLVHLATLFVLIIQRKYVRAIYLADTENVNAPIVSANYCYMLYSDIKNLSNEEKAVIQDVDIKELAKILCN